MPEDQGQTVQRIQLPDSNQTGDISQQPTPTQRLTLAYSILGGSALMLVVSWAGLIWAPEAKKEESEAIFDFAKTIIPPIMTLVIGYYFSSETSVQAATD